MLNWCLFCSDFDDSSEEDSDDRAVYINEKEPEKKYKLKRRVSGNYENTEVFIRKKVEQKEKKKEPKKYSCVATVLGFSFSFGFLPGSVSRINF